MAVNLLERGTRVHVRVGDRREEHGGLARLRQLDLVLIVSTLMVSLVGSVAVYAATRTAVPSEPTYYLKRQVVFSIIGVVVMIAVASSDYRRLEQWAYPVFGALIVSLLAAFAIGKSTVTAGSGVTSSAVAQRWINIGPFQFQPSEFAVLGLVGVLALYLTRHGEDLNARRLAPVLFMVAVPLLLVVKQPDLGTAIVMFVVVLAMLLVGGVRVRFIVGIVALGVVGFALGIELHLISSTQLARLTSFLHPGAQPLGNNLQGDRGREAIGAGGFAGKGLFHGPLTNLQYVPEQSTDFIFATVGEQLGFAGSAVLIALFGTIALRTLRAAQSARDGLGRLLCAGVLTFFAFSVFQNIGMNVGIMPITGIPLPLVSYGGSAIIVFYAAVGLVLNVEMRRHRIR